jgi:hypothetical protein
MTHMTVIITVNFTPPNKQIGVAANRICIPEMHCSNFDTDTGYLDNFREFPQSLLEIPSFVSIRSRPLPFEFSTPHSSLPPPRRYFAMWSNVVWYMFTGISREVPASAVAVDGVDNRQAHRDTDSHEQKQNLPHSYNSQTFPAHQEPH